MNDFTEKIYVCTVCNAEYTLCEVIRKYGIGIPFGYCSSRCYTTDRMGGDKE